MLCRCRSPVTERSAGFDISARVLHADAEFCAARRSQFCASGSCRRERQRERQSRSPCAAATRRARRGSGPTSAQRWGRPASSRRMNSPRPVLIPSCGGSAWLGLNGDRVPRQFGRHGLGVERAEEHDRGPSILTARIHSFFSREGDGGAMNVPSALRAPLQSNWPSACAICAG